MGGERLFPVSQDKTQPGLRLTASRDLAPIMMASAFCEAMENGRGLLDPGHQLLLGHCSEFTPEAADVRATHGAGPAVAPGSGASLGQAEMAAMTRAYRSVVRPGARAASAASLLVVIDGGRQSRDTSRRGDRRCPTGQVAIGARGHTSALRKKKDL